MALSGDRLDLDDPFMLLTGCVIQMIISTEDPQQANFPHSLSQYSILQHPAHRVIVI